MGNVDRCLLGTLARGGTRSRGSCLTSSCAYSNFYRIMNRWFFFGSEEEVGKNNPKT